MHKIVIQYFVKLIRKLDNIKKEISEENKKEILSLGNEMYKMIFDSSQLTSELAKLHIENFKEKVYNSASNKYKVSFDEIKDAIYFEYLEHLMVKISEKKDITDREKICLLDLPEFISAFGNLITFLLYQAGYAIHNLSDILDYLVKLINDNTRPDYIIITCPKDYYCGRALYIRTEPGKNSRILIYRTNDKAEPQQIEVLEKAELIPGGYYKKYLKYKAKYLKLKNS